MELNFSSHLVLDERFVHALESAPLFISEVAPKYEYKSGKRTDKVIGSTVTLEVDRHYEGSLRSARFKISTTRQFSEDVVGRDVTVSIDKDETKVWARSRSASYATIEVSLWGDVEFLNNSLEAGEQ